MHLLITHPKKKKKMSITMAQTICQIDPQNEHADVTLRRKPFRALLIL